MWASWITHEKHYLTGCKTKPWSSDHRDKENTFCQQQLTANRVNGQTSGRLITQYGCLLNYIWVILHISLVQTKNNPIKVLSYVLHNGYCCVCMMFTSTCHGKIYVLNDLCSCWVRRDDLSVNVCVLTAHCFTLCYVCTKNCQINLVGFTWRHVTFWLLLSLRGCQATSWNFN